MKKTYETPSVEKITFEYKDQVVASNGNNCEDVWVNVGVESCTEDNAHWEKLN